jgi:hypothetical protein
LETELQAKGRELVRQLMQDHLQLRSQREQRLPEVIDAEQMARGSVETRHTRALTTVSTVRTLSVSWMSRRSPADQPNARMTTRSATRPRSSSADSP